jgi:hypothetical protein
MDDADDGLEFFNSLSGNLRITLSDPAKPLSDRVMNLVASADAKVVEIELALTVYLRDQQAFRELTEEEWSRVALEAPSIRLRGEADAVIEVPAPNGRSFTVRELAAAIEQAERASRGDSEWMGGVDAHHVFFEGLELEDDGVYQIRWGS